MLILGWTVPLKGNISQFNQGFWVLFFFNSSLIIIKSPEFWGQTHFLDWRTANRQTPGVLQMTWRRDSPTLFPVLLEVSKCCAPISVKANQTWVTLKSVDPGFHPPAHSRFYSPRLFFFFFFKLLWLQLIETLTLYQFLRWDPSYLKVKVNVLLPSGPFKSSVPSV